MLSVIVPTLNEEKYIGRCLKSIKKQDVEKEIIVFDSESKDKTAQIARKYADKVIVSKKMGVGVARNEGAKKAKGDIFLFIDADITLDKGVFKRLLEKLEDSKVKGVCGVASCTGKFRYRLIYHLVYLVTDIFLLFNIPLFPTMFAAYRRKTFERVKGFREWTSAEDYDLSFRMRKLGKFTTLRDGIYTPPRRLEGHYWKYVYMHIRNGLLYILFRKEGSRDYPAFR